MYYHNLFIVYLINDLAWYIFYIDKLLGFHTNNQVYLCYALPHLHQFWQQPAPYIISRPQMQECHAFLFYSISIQLFSCLASIEFFLCLLLIYESVMIYTIYYLLIDNICELNTYFNSKLFDFIISSCLFDNFNLTNKSNYWGSIDYKYSIYISLLIWAKISSSEIKINIRKYDGRFNIFNKWKKNDINITYELSANS